MKTRKVYMDNNATTPLHPQVKEEMIKAMEVFGNPSSLHQFGRAAKAMMQEAREKVASFIGGSPEEIIFTGSGSEANNTVLSILVCPSRECDCSKVGKFRRIITTVIEHPCILETAKCLSDRDIKVSYLSVDQYGKVRIEELEDELKKGPALVSIMTANNEIGTIQDIKQISRLVHQYGSLFHTDAIQAVGKIPVAVNDLEVDFLTLSGHKVYGPKGIGALYVRRGTPFCPLIRGGHQESGRRAGTENTLGIVGFGKAVEMRKEEMPSEHERLLQFKERLKEGLKNNIDHIYFNGHPQDCLANTLNVSFPGAEGEAILLYLDLAGIAVSTGSACASGSLDPSHVLVAIGIPIEYAHGSIRISMGRNTTLEDIDYMIEVMPGIIKRIRNMSTVEVGGKEMANKIDWVYSERLKEHFLNPRNILEDEDSYQEDGKGIVGNIKCGDQMMVVIKVDKAKGIITDCKWKTYGCASAIASTSILSEMVKGMTLEDAYHISAKDIARELDGLPEHKIHCSVLGDKALRAAINDYYRRNGMEDKIKKEEARIVCQCLNITDKEIEEAVLNGARTYLELQERTKIGTVCGQCKEETLDLLAKYKKEHFGE